MEGVLLFDTGSARMGRGVPARILVYPNEVEVRTPRPPRRTTQTRSLRPDSASLRGTQIAFADLVIETRGGGTLTLAGMAKANAEEAHALIQGCPDIPEPPGTALSVPPDIPEQVRKLAEPRDAGVLDEDEFEAKK